MLVQDYDLAEEIAQEGFARAWASPGTPRDPVEFRRWLYRIITNLAHDHFRRQKQMAGLRVPSSPAPDPVATLEERSIDESLEAALGSLSPGEREAIYLRYFEDQSFRETARILGRPEVSVRVVVFRALRKLRQRLESSGQDQKMAVL